MSWLPRADKEQCGAFIRDERVLVVWASVQKGLKHELRLVLSLKLEKHMAAMVAEVTANSEDLDEDDNLEERALQLAIEETFEESGRKYRPWASNAKSIRVGELILIDCLRDAAREMSKSPEVGIIQHESDVMQVANHYFENGIAHFTRRINKSISLGCSNGEVAPFVGHNAFLVDVKDKNGDTVNCRWTAKQVLHFIQMHWHVYTSESIYQTVCDAVPAFFPLPDTELL
ncbi:hypothetical protein BC835DRAFT_1462543 [Cytidiella melzeri]|nr:hypothetical protein BC835DRAFT_1462543 [Cytidiella melzeri]